MPIYVYACPTCGNSVEKIRTMSARDEPVSCETCSSGCFTLTLMRRQATAPAAFQVHGFSALNGYTGERTFETMHKTGKLAGIRTKVTGRPEGFSDGLHK